MKHLLQLFHCHSLTAIWLVIILLFPTISQAQHKKSSHTRQFDFELRGGLNFCQIDGDASGNYNKIGYHGAINSSFPLGESEEWRFQVEIGLTEKGSRIDNSSLDRHISLLYVEVPLLVTYNTMDNQLRIGAGIAPAILAKSKVTTDGAYDNLQSNNYKILDGLPVCVSLRYRLTEHVGVDVRWYNSMLNTAIENGSGTYRLFRSNKGQFNRLIQAGIALDW